MPLLLLVAATEPESGPLRQRLGFAPLGTFEQAQVHDWDIHLLHTRVGMVSTALALGTYLAQHQPQRAIHFGIAGSLDRATPLGTVVELVQDTFIEMGADSPGGKLDLSDLGLPTLVQKGQPYFDTFINDAPYGPPYPPVQAVTVNRVAGEAKAIAQRFDGTQATIETMESGAFFQAMQVHEVPFWSVRAISNYIEPRNRASWQIPAAITAVNQAVISMISTLR